MSTQNFKEKYDLISQERPTLRGFRFEKLINMLFKSEGTLIQMSYREPETQQQIDGAIEVNGKIFLLECKWEDNETIAASKLFSFIGKINSKIDGTLGLFISHEELQSHVIEAARWGTKQNCIIIHGSANIVPFFELEDKISNYVWHIYRRASTHGAVTDDFKSFQVSGGSIDVLRTGNRKDPWMEIYQALNDSTSIIAFNGLISRHISEIEDLHAKTIISGAAIHRTNFEKLKRLVREAKIIDKKSYCTEFLARMTCDGWQAFCKEELFEILSNDVVPSTIEAIAVADLALDFWPPVGRDYDVENISSIAMNWVWDYLPHNKKREIYIKVLPIYQSSSDPRFPQKKFTKRIFEDRIECNLSDFTETFENSLRERYLDVYLENSAVTPEEERQMIRRVASKNEIILNLFQADPVGYISAIYKSIYPKLPK